MKKDTHYWDVSAQLEAELAKDGAKKGIFDVAIAS
jgi:hypothetical protein